MPESGSTDEQLFTLKPLHVLLVGAGVLSSGELPRTGLWAAVAYCGHSGCYFYGLAAIQLTKWLVASLLNLS